MNALTRHRAKPGRAVLGAAATDLATCPFEAPLEVKALSVDRGERTLLVQPAPPHQRLAVFVGQWRARGESYAEGQRRDDPRASALPWTSDESYQWLPGRFFLLHRWDAMAGSRVFQGTEVIGFDAEGGYFTQLFDNAGNHPTYRLAAEGNVWTFSEPATRATVTVAPDGDSMRFRWEWRGLDGGDWRPLCDRTAHRVGESLANHLGDKP